MSELTAARLRELLHYDPETGVFTWKAPRRRTLVGAVAGTPHTKGYVCIVVDRQKLYAHRLAWLYVHGSNPSGQIDHVDGDRTNNRAANLRDVPAVTNRQNQRIAMGRSKTGLLGVCAPNRFRKDFLAQIGHDRKQIRLGRFATAEEAHAAYLAAKRRIHEGCTI